MQLVCQQGGCFAGDRTFLLPQQSFNWQALARSTCCSSINSQRPKALLSGRQQVALRFRAEANRGIVKSPSVKQAAQALNIAFVSAEVAPWSKTGGLGDVVGGLPVELARRGHKVLSICPRYDQHRDAWDTSVTVEIDGQEVRYFHTVKDAVDRVWVDHPWFLEKVFGKTGSKLYGSKSGSDYSDNQRRFLLFNKAALKALEVLPFSPGTETLVVANDWHTALLPVLVKEVYQKNGQYMGIKTALCIHNIAFQGRFWRKDWPVLGLPDRVKPFFEFVDGYTKVYMEGEPEEFEMAPVPKGVTYEKINWLKAGILSADKLLTVSPNYAAEIAEDDEKGVELASVIKQVGGLEGIVNGCDVNEWSPFLDKYLDVKYDAETMEEGKAIAKETLQAELGLQVDPSIPVFGFIGRLEEQKGVDILIEALPAVAAQGGAQVVVLGTGKKALEAAVLQLDKQFPDTVKGVVKFDVPLAHLMTAGADFMLVPSRFEPCGLIQLHAMNYGTVPIVSSTGGLVDTVKDGVTGFHAGRFNPDRLDKADSEALAKTILRAAAAFPTPAFQTMRERCIVQELSWEKPARKWEAVLEELWHSQAAPTATQQAATATKQAAAEQRRASHPTPVQAVNKEGDAVPRDAVARKAAATQSVIEQTKPAGLGQAASASTSAPVSRAPSPATAPSLQTTPPMPSASPAASPAPAAGSAASPAALHTKPQAAGSSASAGSSETQSSPLKAAAAQAKTAEGTPESKPAAVPSAAAANGAGPKRRGSASNGAQAGTPKRTATKKAASAGASKTQ